MAAIRALPVGNERPDLCRPCGGACCKAGPGIMDPKDLGSDVAGGVAAALVSGKFKVGWGGEPGKGLFLAPATVDADADPIDFWSPNKPCALLTAKGCSLPFAARPRQCRDLEARPPRQSVFDLGCSTGNAQKFYLDLWAPYQESLARAIGTRMAEVVGMSSHEPQVLLGAM